MKPINKTESVFSDLAWDYFSIQDKLPFTTCIYRWEETLKLIFFPKFFLVNSNTVWNVPFHITKSFSFKLSMDFFSLASLWEANIFKGKKKH